MRRKYCLFWVVFSAFALLSVPYSHATNNDDSTVQLQVNAKSAMLIEVSTGEVLFAQDVEVPIEPASFTKIITLFMVFEAIRNGVMNLEDKISISEQAWRTGGSKMFVEVNSRVPLEELIKGIAVVSGNDACVAVAEHLQGSVEAFVGVMNRRAKELGMTSSTFRNPHGLPAEGQITTTRDMVTFVTAYLRRFPQSLKYHSMREYTYSNITQPNRNRLLVKDESVDGLKTGYVAAGGYHLAATAQRDGMRLLAVVMGAPTPGAREREALKLLNYGFRHYALVQAFPENQPVTAVKLWKGIKDSLDVYPTQAASLLIPQAQKKDVRWEVNVEQNVTAPVQLHQTLGKVILYLGNEPRRTINLVSHEEVGQAGWAKRVWHGVLQVHNVPWRWIGGIAGAVAVILIVGLLITSSFRARQRSRL